MGFCSIVIRFQSERFVLLRRTGILQSGFLGCFVGRLAWNLTSFPIWSKLGNIFLLSMIGVKLISFSRRLGWNTKVWRCTSIWLCWRKIAVRQSFIRGAFLAGGSVTDPDKRYHLELVTGHLKVSDEVRSILQELGFEPKDTQRTGSGVLYLKQSDQIVDFLTMIGAPLCAMKIIQAKMEKEIRNEVNRRVNCDTANLSKAVDAAQQQLAAIRILRESGKFDQLPEKLQQTARLREEYPEATLSELAAMVVPPVSKPAISHRMRCLIARSKQ